MYGVLNHLLVLAQSGTGLSNFADARAGTISLVGLTAVFAGLFLLLGFMRGLAYLMQEKIVKTPEDVKAAAEAEVEVDSGAQESEAEPEAELPELPLTGPLSLPATSLVAAQVARTMYEQGKLELGKEITITVEGKPCTVTLVTVGLATTAIVNERKVIFYRSRTAGVAANG